MTKKILFMGTPQFSVPILQALIDSAYEVVGVVTQPDRPVGRKKVLTPSPVKQLAVNYNIPVYQPEKLVASEELDTLLNTPLDLIVTAAYGQFLPASLLHHPKYHSINVHASLLPKYRGGAPIQFALMNGDHETGVSIMYMEKKMDAGDVLAQVAIPIEESDNVSTLFDKLSLVGRDALIDVLPNLFSGNICAVPQNEELVTFSPALSREQEKLDFSKDARTVHNHIRAMNEWPGAYTLLNGERFKIWESRIAPNRKGNIGELIVSKESMSVCCGNDTSLELCVVQPAGKGKMSVADFRRGVGASLQTGDQFE
ncbi:methionyl-tRNA formyltransferase [Carnobacteriaceae bacterium zg-ZUI252]|nr:methionyl-tRNA formyltransferase [Carnobacteriaceae bacterium zg-ZUI252]